MDLKIGSLEDGTAIGSGLATAVNRLRRAPDKSKVVLLLTDGENNRGLIDPRTAAATAAAYGIKVYTIGVGTIGEAPIPTGRGLGGFRYELLPVRIDEPLLREIAAKTGGRYFRARDSEALSRIFRQIDELEKTPDPGDPLHEIRGSHPAPDPARARAPWRSSWCSAARWWCASHDVRRAAPAVARAGARARAGLRRVARPRPPHPARAAVVARARAARARARHLGAARARPRRAARRWWRWRARAGAAREIRTEARALSLVFAMDISRSMLAEDASPNRLQRSMREARRLIQDLEGDRLGLIAFAGPELHPGAAHGGRQRDPPVPRRARSRPRERRRLRSLERARPGRPAARRHHRCGRPGAGGLHRRRGPRHADRHRPPGRGAEGGGRPPDHGGRGVVGPLAHPHPRLDRHAPRIQARRRRHRHSDPAPGRHSPGRRGRGRGHAGAERGGRPGRGGAGPGGRDEAESDLGDAHRRPRAPRLDPWAGGGAAAAGLHDRAPGPRARRIRRPARARPHAPRRSGRRPAGARSPPATRPAPRRSS